MWTFVGTLKKKRQITEETQDRDQLTFDKRVWRTHCRGSFTANYYESIRIWRCLDQNLTLIERLLEYVVKSEQITFTVS